VRNGLDLEAAKVAVRETMVKFEYGGKPLGYPRFKSGGWIQCGVAGDEEAVPTELKRDYCGMWFHWKCAGILRAPKDKNERV
jgi:hypothetical protein